MVVDYSRDGQRAFMLVGRSFGARAVSRAAAVEVCPPCLPAQAVTLQLVSLASEPACLSVRRDHSRPT